MTKFIPQEIIHHSPVSRKPSFDKTFTIRCAGRVYSAARTHTLVAEVSRI